MSVMPMLKLNDIASMSAMTKLNGFRFNEVIGTPTKLMTMLNGTELRFHMVSDVEWYCLISATTLSNSIAPLKCLGISNC